MKSVKTVSVRTLKEVLNASVMIFSMVLIANWNWMLVSQEKILVIPWVRLFASLWTLSPTIRPLNVTARAVFSGVGVRPPYAIRRINASIMRLVP